MEYTKGLTSYLRHSNDNACNCIDGIKSNKEYLVSIRNKKTISMLLPDDEYRDYEKKHIVNYTKLKNAIYKLIIDDGDDTILCVLFDQIIRIMYIFNQPKEDHPDKDCGQRFHFKLNMCQFNNILDIYTIDFLVGEYLLFKKRGQIGGIIVENGRQRYYYECDPEYKDSRRFRKA